ncbi:hypothetical protein J2R98_000684 [Alkalibacillus filiformis]|uniref:Uncharacterized protein n=1 Tax=Alkalibacillus filiformis TaxID=200990 RepID=A0ABU0DR12_9BACI|nr:hypothetical protein [Alkalibacillus filiformis]MDQ0350881.1 hypothetical protein [Alkalibacillus filiformis]
MSVKQERIKNSSEEHKEYDVLNLPPRSKVHHKQKRKGGQEEQSDSHKNEQNERPPNLFLHKLSIHFVLILFILLIISIPLYYQFVMQ